MIARILFTTAVLLLLSACTDDPELPCNGYATEPSILIENVSGTQFGVFYLNQFSFGDTVFSDNSNTLRIPIDVQSDTMFYEVVTDTSIGKLFFVYDTEHQYCTSTDHWNVYFKNATITLLDNLPDLFTDADGERIKVNSGSDYTNFMNRTLSNPKLVLDF
ncbi:MAG: hypothetical protein JJ975_03240 [Bacteroidia bacterium]|nr:hypothetical protein [Bacteroidia bacterium]